MNAVSRYFQQLADRFGEGWNRFWYTPQDPLPLCAIRLLAGLLALYTVATYTPDLQRLFGPEGLLTRETVAQFRGDLPPGSVNPAPLRLSNFSLLDLAGTSTALWVVHGLCLGVLVLMTLGVLSRVTSVLGLIAVLSHLHRAPMLTSQLESVLAMIMVYVCVGPNGARLSVDRLLARRKDPDGAQPTRRWTANLALRLIQLHFCLIVLASGLSKVGAETWWVGDAVWWLIARFETTPADLRWLHQWPYLVNAWTHAIVAFELAFPILVWNRWARPLMLGLLPLYLLLVVLPTGLFAFAAAVLIAALAFVPPSVIEALMAGKQPAASASEETSASDEEQVAVGSGS